MAYIPRSYTPETLQNIVTGAGEFFANLPIMPLMKPTANFKTEIAPFLLANRESKFGATRGGGSFNAVPTIEEIPVDGMTTYPRILRSWESTFASTGLEISYKTLMRLAPLEVDPETGGLIASSTLRDSHYFSVTHVGMRMGEAGHQIIHAKRCISTAGIAQELAERGESTVPFTLTMEQDEDEATGTLLSPFYVWLFDSDGNMEKFEEIAQTGGITGAAAQFAPQLAAAHAELAKAQSSVNAVNLEIQAAEAKAKAEAVLKESAPKDAKSGRYETSDKN